jgi:hypothetical protein
MKKILFILTLILAITLSACNSISLEDKCNEKTYREDITTLTEKKLITESDKELLTSFIANHRSGSSVLSLSYGELLSHAKKQQEIIEKAKAKAKTDFSSSALGKSF